jgi:dienelactone hydrolase
VVKQIEALFANGKKTGHAETVPDTFHGWMGTRSNLKDEKNVKQFEDGYKEVAEYFLEHL